MITKSVITIIDFSHLMKILDVSNMTNNKKTTVVSGRIPNYLRDEMIKEDMTVREAVSIALSIKANPKKKYEAELKNLISRNEILSNEMVSNNARIEEIKDILGIDSSIEDLKQQMFANENDKAVQKTLDYFNTWGKGKLSIHNFIELKSDVIEKYRRTCDLSHEEFCLLLIERCDSSKQTTLD